MPRMTPASCRDDDLSDIAKEAYDRIVADRGRLSGPTALLLPYAPELAVRVSAVGTVVRYDTGLTRAQTELATIAAARGLDSAYIWAAHVPPALEEGIPPATVDVVNSGAPVDELDPAHAIVISVARQLIEDHHLDDETFAAARAQFGESGLLELATLVGFYSMISCAINTAQLVPRDVAPPLLPRERRSPI